MRTLGQWDLTGSCAPSQVPLIASRRNMVVIAYNNARNKIIESQDADLVNKFNALKTEVDTFHYSQQRAYPCPWADHRSWGSKFGYYAGRFDALRSKANSIIAKGPGTTTPTPATPATPKPPTQPGPKPTAAKPCSPAPCGPPPSHMKCKVPGRGTTNPVCKCGKWVCPGGPSLAKIQEMKSKGRGGISPYMSQAYGVKRYAAPKPKAKPVVKPKPKTAPAPKPKAAGLGGSDIMGIPSIVAIALVGAGVWAVINR